MNKKSHWCGKRLKICHKSKCTIATVTDACPTCDHGKKTHSLKPKTMSNVFE